MPLPQRILIVNPFGIGDVLFSTPLIRAVRRAFPQAHVAYLCNRRTQEILRRNQDLNELFVYEKDEVLALWRRSRLAAIRTVVSLLGQVRRRRFDLAIDLSLGERYSFMLAVLGVPRRIGFDFRHRGRFLTHRFAMDGYQDQHVVDYYTQLLEMIGIRQLDRQLHLDPMQGERLAVEHRLRQLDLREGQHVIGLVPAGGVSWGRHAHFRRWPQAKFVEVGRHVSARYGARILIFGEPSDRSICTGIAQAIGPAAVDLSGQTSFGEFVGLLARCDLVICNDGGPLHLAVSQGVKTVSIFGPVDPVVYGPYGSVDHHRVVTKSLPCRPCYHQFKLPPCPYDRACLNELSIDEVLPAVEKMLNDVEVRC